MNLSRYGKEVRTGHSASGMALTRVLASRDRRLKISQGSDERLGTTATHFSFKENDEPLQTLS